MLTHSRFEGSDIPNEAYALKGAQGFAWYRDAVIYDLDQENCWVEIYQTQRLEEVSSNVSRAILLPFSVPEAGHLFMMEYSDILSFEILPGQYQLLFERRQLTENELFSIEKYAAFAYQPQGDSTSRQFPRESPEHCKLTFVPTQEPVEPKLLKFMPLNMGYKTRRKLESGEIAPESLFPKELVLSNKLLSDVAIP
ncbi:MAG: competence protein ComJ [Leptolyngbyaceae cyanobacterium]